MEAVARKNPHINEFIEMMDSHLMRYGGDIGRAWVHLGKAESQLIEEELEHCALDARYYMENYHVVATENEGLKTLYPFWDSQEMIHRKMEELRATNGYVKLCILKARQLGSSTLCQGRSFHRTIFTPTTNTLIVAQDPGQADYLFSMSRLAFDSLPWWMRPEHRYQAKGRFLILDRKDDLERQMHPGLKSNIFVEAANKVTGVARGKTIHCSHLSELASWQDGGMLSQSVMPTMNATNGIYVMESTAEGRHGFWFSWWRDTVSGKTDWVPLFIEYFRVKKYSKPIKDKAKFKLTDEELALRAKMKRRTNFEISDETFNWVRAKKREFIALEGDEWKFYQEYPCLIGSTRVPTDKGIILLDQCLDARSTNGKAILAFLPKGEREVFTATTRLGYEVTGTADHVLPTRDGEAHLEDLTGKTVLLSVPEFAAREVELEWEGPCTSRCAMPVSADFARFLGYFLGDGCFLGGTISICCDGKDEDVIADVEYLLTKFFGSCTRRVVGTKRGGIELRSYAASFKEVMLALGIWNPKGRPHRKIVVPEVIWRSPKNIVREFLRGLFEADGFSSYSTPRVSLYSKHMDFLRDVQILLLGFGITASRRSRPATNGNGYHYTASTLDLRAAESKLFNRKIGFIGARKSSRFKGVEAKVGRPQAAIELADEVVSIVPAGVAPVYDITVRGDHLFSANGILVHNCGWMEAFQGSGQCAFPKRLLQKILESQCVDPRWYGEIYFDPTRQPRDRIKLVLTEAKPDVKIPNPDFEGGRLRIWEHPEDGGTYYVSVDVAHGVEGGDYSVCQVLKIGRGMEPDVQVAEWHGWINPTPLAYVAAGLGYYYNEAQIAVECNDVGMTTNNELFRIIEYENIYRWKHIDKVKNFITDLFGWWTNSKTRDLIIAKGREAIVDRSIILRSESLLDEMLDFSSDEGGRFEGQDTNDDRVMAFLIGRYCAHESDYGRESATKPSMRPPSSVTHFVFDQLNRIRWQGTDKQHAEDLVHTNPGWSCRTQQLRRDFSNTDYSPVHDKAGLKQQLHYQFGIPAEMIKDDFLIYYNMAAGTRAEEGTEIEEWKRL